MHCNLYHEFKHEERKQSRKECLTIHMPLLLSVKKNNNALQGVSE
jgi:hypothetical protein